MNLGLKYRERCQAVGQFLVGEFDNLVASINAAWNPQHNDDGSHGAITATTIVTTGNITTALDLSARNITASLKSTAAQFFRPDAVAAQGEWLDVPFAATNFTASAGAWTVIAANQVTYAYTLVAKTMTVVFQIDSTNVTAAPGLLALAIPASRTAKKATVAIIQAGNAGAFQAGIAFVNAAGAVINFQSTVAGAGWALTGASNTFVRGEITFEVT